MFIIWTMKEYKLVTLQPIYTLSATNFKLQNYLLLGNHLSKHKNGKKKTLTSNTLKQMFLKF